MELGGGGRLLPEIAVISLCVKMHCSLKASHVRDVRPEASRSPYLRPASQTYDVVFGQFTIADKKAVDNEVSELWWSVSLGGRSAVMKEAPNLL